MMSKEISLFVSFALCGSLPFSLQQHSFSLSASNFLKSIPNVDFV